VNQSAPQTILTAAARGFCTCVDSILFFADSVIIGQPVSIPDNFPRTEEIEVESVKILVLGDAGVGKYAFLNFRACVPRSQFLGLLS
jgi:hypothetical protein